MVWHAQFQRYYLGGEIHTLIRGGYLGSVLLAPVHGGPYLSGMQNSFMSSANEF